MHVTLEQAKKQLIIDSDFLGDDDLLRRHIEAAEIVVSKELGRPLDSFLLPDGMLRPDIVQTILLMVTNFYNNRDPVAFAKAIKVPLGYEFMIGLNKDYSK